MPNSKWEIPAERIARLREYLQKTVDDGFFAGVTSCVVQRGKVLQRDAFGHRNVEDGSPMTNDSIFRIASSTKPIIAAAMLALYDEGRWKLDDPVAKFIPEFAKLKVREKDGSIVDPVQPMLMRHLMCHGIGFSLRPARDGASASGGSSPPPASSRPDWARGDLQTLINRLSDEPLAFHPGKRFLYGMCCDVQGYIIEKLSGHTLDRFL